ncbi:eukaryotic translation initiation factor 3 subunit M isoform X2 [Parasteatoda tepidariorum]|uniref:eukaryotic translation initiation factor 3 subunit M isoform X2 n=1 Tax=Parasteatoda tepidariorum TaxID=114398 RepID=UPI0039BC81C7
MVFKDLSKLKSWLTDLNVSTEKLQKLLCLLLGLKYCLSQSELAAKVRIELLGTYTEDNASQVGDDTHKKMPEVLLI